MLSGTKLAISMCMNMLKESFGHFEMDGNITDTISKLKFIGLIQKGEKINVRSMYVQPANTIMTRISRTFITTDNRNNTYNFIEGVINRSFEIITISLTKDPIKSIDKRLVKNLLHDLSKSITGIKNLRDTYAYDSMFCCRLDTMVESIESRLSDIQETYIGYFDTASLDNESVD